MKRHPLTRQLAKELRTKQTPPEQALWALLRAGRLGVKFTRQLVIAPYIADFAARSERLIVELDGESHVGREEQDATRTAFFETRGYRVMRFTNSEIMTNPEGVTRAIMVALGQDPEIPRALEGERDRRSEAAPGSGGGPDRA